MRAMHNASLKYVHTYKIYTVCDSDERLLILVPNNQSNDTLPLLVPNNQSNDTPPFRAPEATCGARTVCEYQIILSAHKERTPRGQCGAIC